MSAKGETNVPFYDYRCPGCGYEEESMHGINAQVYLTCPDCNIPLKKVIPGVPFKFVSRNSIRVRSAENIPDDIVENRK